MVIELIDWLLGLFGVDYEETPLRVFVFITFRSVVAAATALFLGFVLGPFLIERDRKSVV